jgi:hydroxyacylglutathione hydrolase
VVTAPNPGPFTLDGTRTFLVGEREVAVIDPGPDVEEHLRTLRASLHRARRVHILLTHSHKDHAAGAEPLARSLDGPETALYGGGHEDLPEGESVPTDQGSLRTIQVPGHSRDHRAFHWQEEGILFVGDLVLGRGDTTWLGEYRGCVADYLESLEKVRALGPRALFPAHGPPVWKVEEVLDAYRAHRRDRLAHLARLRDRHPEASLEELLEAIYGRRLPPRIRKAALASVEVMLYHLEGASESREHR